MTCNRVGEACVLSINAEKTKKSITFRDSENLLSKLLNIHVDHFFSTQIPVAWILFQFILLAQLCNSLAGLGQQRHFPTGEEEDGNWLALRGASLDSSKASEWWYTLLDGRTAVLVICYNRPSYLQRTLDRIVTVWPGKNNGDKVSANIPIFISQDGQDTGVTNVIKKFIDTQTDISVTHLKHPRLSQRSDDQLG